MPLTPAQALIEVKQRGLIISPHPDGGWIAKGKDGGKLGSKKPKPTYEDAVESAVSELIESESRTTEANKSRLFDILSSGDIYYIVRKESVTSDSGPPAQIDVYDILKVSNDSIIVRGERSLIAAIIAAEKGGLVI